MTRAIIMKYRKKYAIIRTKLSIIRVQRRNKKIKRFKNQCVTG